MTRIWDEERIREEIRRLDKKTGLNGASLPITFGKAKNVLGRFHARNKKSEKFYFSDFYFQDPEFVMEEAIDTIRHEYAHYMDFEIYGKCSHSTTWKKCCLEIGANPQRIYNKDRAEYYRKKHEKEKEVIDNCQNFKVGDKVKHPVFKTGTVKDVIIEDRRAYIVIEFPVRGVKKMSAGWVQDHCERV